MQSGGGETAEARALLVRADQARAEGRWADAADLYAGHVELRPRRVGTRLQRGHMLKQLGDVSGAEGAYRSALALRPTVEAWSYLGQLLLVAGRLEEAVDAFEAALALSRDFAPAREGLINAGRRDRLARIDLDPAALDRIRRLAAALPAAIDAIADTAIAPASLYDAFRRRNPAPPPPEHPDAAVVVEIDARSAAPYRLRATLLSLIDQSLVSWTAVVRGAALANHPVASLAVLDPRIRFDSGDAVRDDIATVMLEAGVILEPHALAWMGFAGFRTGAEVVYADHDRHRLETAGPVYFDPALQPAPDADDLASTPSPPVLTWWRSRAPTAELMRRALIDVAAAGRAAHVPLILASVADLPASARHGLPAPEESRDGFLAARPVPSVEISPAPVSQDLRVIVPTRDEHELLIASLDSLRATAAAPDRLRITVVDNGSRTPAMADYLRRERAAGRLSVLTADEPFNWSRLNNLAVAATTEPNLLFLNNDTVMLTPRWDERLSARLVRPEIGVVGARLIYPDGALQHGGIVTGLATGTPRHEGVGAAANDPGPLDRWRRVRSAAAVTGAFMAMRRTVFDEVGGFDAVHLAIAYNDVDLCLKCRERGLRVLFDGGIELVHHESRTRGLNDTRGKLAWDAGEWASLQSRWGDALCRDPSVNPHWATPSSKPFDGIRAVSADEAVHWLDRSIGSAWRA